MMGGRGAVRSSARLSAEAAAAPAPSAVTTGERGRPAANAAAAAAAAARRARAVERSREVEDSPRVLREKCRRLARALRNAKHLVVYTGAGISTAADIPDYRGPHGVWTRLQRGESVRRVDVSRAVPTFTHMALTALWARGALKFVVSQNCDGLHVRAGMPRRALAELHGDMFAELCAPCRRLYLRAFDTTERTARHRHGTRRLCHACGTELRDSIVHFGERGRAAWPLNWAGALRHAARADVVLCLGSSLKVLRRYPRLWRMRSAPSARPALYIVNLQWTPKDAVAALKINARCDAVMRQVARRLKLRVPRYRPARDPLLAHATPLAPPEAHTTRRPTLRVPPEDCSDGGDSSEPSEPSSPSASDSDEELPLRCLADRMRGSPDTPRLRAFRVNLVSGEATILLRAEDAPSPPISPPPASAAARSSTAELRRFRIRRRPPDPPPVDALTNGHTPFAHIRFPRDDNTSQFNGCNSPQPCERNCNLRLNGFEPKFGDVKKEEEPSDAPNGTLGSRLRRLLECESELKKEDELKHEPPTEVKLEPKPERETSVEEGAGSLAAAIIARAVLLCRASLYPGLHTIITPPSPAAAGGTAGAGGAAAAECAWCSRHYSSRRCLWYGPARDTPLVARAWRRVRGRRYLCACCGAGAGEGEPARGPDEGGWYGKGYRKGRRRRR
ncbi:NAD-dependent protein deacetylase sirtuin-7 [Manduca sexta]|uniref:protein acetyllysine N-acetyltransferase n=1 Tax=Manduca sexta TaxID=7130 RepID=A0A922CDJ4_MANSE|nr:NAD-dependent protein deacetylase sirtuin-7 [Manduca sexta]KAG6442312.1 hypothetical protein O3G_MSEX002302 [Manduca sexta]